MQRPWMNLKPCVNTRTIDFISPGQSGRTSCNVLLKSSLTQDSQALQEVSLWELPRDSRM